MMTLDGVVPVMLTPFRADGQIDWGAYERLIEWYLNHQVDALFAVCQSSEMFHLNLNERRDLAAFTVDKVQGRVPVLASGHIADERAEQCAELATMADTGIDVLILVTNRFTDQLSLAKLINAAPVDLPLGLYECPYPARRLLDDDELHYCVDSGRFYVLKDVCCDLPTLKRRLAITKGSPLRVHNANAAIAWDALCAGAAGFCGIANNIHPDLYRVLCEQARLEPRQRADYIQDLVTFLALGGLIETQGYPAVVKRYHQQLNTINTTICRVMDDQTLDSYWGLDALVEHLHRGSEHFRYKIAQSSTDANLNHQV